MAEHQDRFIILKKMKYGEADLIIHALSSQGAKKSFIARSALKSKKRFGGGVLEPTHFVGLTYKDSRNEGGLNVLNEAILIDDFQGLRTDYDKIEIALFFLNCVYHVSQEGDQDSQFLFNLLGHSLRALVKTSNPLRLKLHFCLKFLYQQGVIALDPWMSPFLKTNLADSDQLEVASRAGIVSEVIPTEASESQVKPEVASTTHVQATDELLQQNVHKKSVQESVEDYLDSIESQVLQYLKTADNAGSVY